MAYDFSDIRRIKKNYGRIVSNIKRRDDEKGLD